VSVFLWWGNAPPPGARRVRWLATYRDLGVSRIMVWVAGIADAADALEMLTEDVEAAGLDLAG
jgi:hypothetical protein